MRWCTSDAGIAPHHANERQRPLAERNEAHGYLQFMVVASLRRWTYNLSFQVFQLVLSAFSPIAFARRAPARLGRDSYSEGVPEWSRAKR